MKSVVEYFRETYGFAIQHVQWPCLQVGNTQRPNYKLPDLTLGLSLLTSKHFSIGHIDVIVISADSQTFMV